MAVFRVYDPFPQFTTDLGALAALGKLVFYENLTTTPKSVFAEPELSTDLGNEIDLDAAARTTPSQIWLNGIYSVYLFDADDNEISHADNFRAADETAFPVLPDPADGDDGQVLGVEGGEYALLDILQVPDPSGNSGRQLGTDGELVFWEDKPAETVYTADDLPGGITQDTTSWRIGNMLFQTGSATAPTSGTTATSVGVTFGEAYDTAPVFVGVTPTVGSVTSEGAHVSSQATSITTSGFTANFFAGAEDGGGDLSISTAVTFKWLAIGIAAP